MGFSVFSAILRLFPAWLWVGFAACFLAYYLGISQGRAPYRLAAKIQDARAEIIIKRTNKIRDIIAQKGRRAYEVLDNNECIISDVDARLLSDIIGN